MKRRQVVYIILIALLLFLMWELIFRPAVLLNSLGSAFYRHKKYHTAEKIFAQKDNATLKGNRAKALYQQGKYEEADAAYSQAQRDLDYDAGNAAFQKNELEKARDKYIEALFKDPKDYDAKANLELTLKRLQKQPQQSNKDDKNKDSEDKVRNILDALDQKERQDRKQQQQPKGNGRTRDWW